MSNNAIISVSCFEGFGKLYAGQGGEGGGLSYLFEGVNEVKTMWLGSLVTRNQGSVLMHAQVIKLRLVTKNKEAC